MFFFDVGPVDALLEVHLHAEVLVHFGGCVVTLGRVNVKVEAVYEGKGLVFAQHGFVETVREDSGVVHEGEQLSSRAHAASAKSLLLGFCGEVRKKLRARSRLGVS